ncbi:DUF2804 domain-containing protein [Actinomadura citrea]|jgi:hypothetical protein|uniref:DUF2804 domain-containing protein n=1 Tax=Actinomadura citrea TaxID=46158 RepID=A0A7Y9KH30_9ACTN|nr:DUF2804 domain-containing protein [Actinomadura citrea]NYE15608.1 hypothetical protein [Actinomadura citrea]GGT66011.1 hypothetical protein GCM10010177_23820 [Actinomadura citrea]
MPTHEREITEPVDLCTPDGRLDPRAVGWTRRPLHRANLRGWGRAKRWEYWGIVTPRHVIGLVASSLDYAAVHGVYVLDRDTGEETSRDGVVPFARGAVFPDRSGSGEASVRGAGVAVGVRQGPSGSRVRALVPGLVDLDVRVPLPDGHESLGVVVPWSARRFQYTVKDVGRPVHGRLRLPSGDHEIGDGAFAVLDHGRGKWPYRMTWNWAAASGPGLALQLGGKWTDGTGMTENALFAGGRLHKIGEELDWSYDRGDWLRPWTIRGPRVEAEFRPFHEKVARTELGVVGTETHQCFGHFSGRAQADDGTWLDFDGLTGWAEESRQRW